jgi:tartrate-resistant acid phosphatase type 5
MAAAAQRAPPQFVVSVGDNFYPSGLTSVGDANFADSFQNVYHHAELQVSHCRRQCQCMSAAAAVP